MPRGECIRTAPAFINVRDPLRSFPSAYQSRYEGGMSCQYKSARERPMAKTVGIHILRWRTSVCVGRTSTGQYSCGPAYTFYVVQLGIRLSSRFDLVSCRRMPLTDWPRLQQQCGDLTTANSRHLTSAIMNCDFGCVAHDRCWSPSSQ